MAVVTVRRATQPLRGAISLPGDKSISHRRALFSLLTHEPVTIENFGSGEDCETSLRCIERLGKFVQRDDSRVAISGSLSAKRAELDCGNSGTTARLLMGLLAGCEGEFILRGDDSLSRRPMERIARPLRQMGAEISLTEGHFPAIVRGARLHAIEYESPIASAQVKSAVLLAGLHASGITRFREPQPSRDHTERLLGVVPDRKGWIQVDATQKSPASVLSGFVPGDPSSAAFWIVAMNLVQESEIELKNVLANPGRIAYFDLLLQAGADIRLGSKRECGGEEVCDIGVKASKLVPFTVSKGIAASLIDEIPALAVLSATLDGRSEFHDVGELRVKESDRIRLMVDNLRAIGADVEEWEDGFAVSGRARMRGTRITTAGDHRIALAFAVAGLLAEGETQILDAECAAVSYPEFWTHLKQVAPGSLGMSA